MRKRTKSIGISRICAILCTLTMLVSSLTGCGGEVESEPVQSSSQVSSGSVEPSASSSIDIETLLQATDADLESELVWAGTQYYDGEAITVWRRANGAEDFSKSQDIYIKDAKGFITKVVSDAAGNYTKDWYWTPDGYSFAIFDNQVARIEADGTETYNVYVGAAVNDFCRLNDGRVMMIITEGTGSNRLAELNVETGEYTIVEALDFGRDNRVYITAGENGLLLLNGKGFWNVNPDTGELTQEIPMSEYEFVLPYTLKDFRMLDGASIELLYQDKSEVKHPKDISKYREVVTIQTRFEDQWLNAMLKGFNDSNYQYYAVQEPKMDIMELSNGGISDTITLSIPYEQWEKEIAGGGGADLIEGNCIADYGYFVDMGYLEDLAPYMEKSGMDQLDYFPAAFETGKRGESIHVANLNLSMSGLRIKEEVLGNRLEPSVEYLMDRLLAYSEPAVLCDNWGCQNVLHFLLAGSEDLWGCIDWENKTCDFRSDFFAKALEVSWLFGDEDTMLPAVGQVYNHRSFYGYINDEQLELADEVYLGFLFDDGCYPWMPDATSLAINRNSQCKEGAWAVLEYLLSEEAQTQKWLTNEEGERLTEREYPVNIYAFEAIVLLEQEETALFEYTLNGDSKTIYKANYQAFRDLNRDKDAYRALYDLKEADVEEVRELMYEMRYMPGKPAEILDIIYEEAEKYFNEVRSLGETCEAIQKRVQAYLDAYEE